VVALALLVAAGATVHFGGRVVDGETDKPVGDAVVIVIDPATKKENTSVTDPSGRFETEAPLGTFEVAVQRVDYKPFSRMETRLGSTDDWVAVLSPDHLCVWSDREIYDHPTPDPTWADSHWSRAFRRLFASSGEDAKRIGVEFYVLPTIGIDQALRVQRGRKGEASVVALRLEEPLRVGVDKFVEDHKDDEALRDNLRAAAFATVVPPLHVEAAPLSETTAIRLERLWESAFRASRGPVDPCPFVQTCGADLILALGGRAVSLDGWRADPGTRTAALLDIRTQLSEFASAPAKERAAREGRLLDAIDALLVRFDDAEQKRAEQASTPRKADASDAAR